MPLRSHGQLLRGIAALFSVCAACGCLSQSQRRSDLRDTQVDAAILRPVVAGEPTIAGPAIVARAAPPSESVFNGPIVKMLRPRPQEVTAVETGPVVTSDWRSPATSNADTAAGSQSGIRQVQHSEEPAVAPAPAPAGRLVPQACAPSVEEEAHGFPWLHLHAPRPIAALPVPREFEKQAMPPYRIEPPDILLIRASKAITLPTQPLDGQHLVKMDGYVNLGIYGEVFLAGRSLEEARDLVAAALLARRVKGKDPKDLANPAAKETELTIEDIKRELQVDVLAYNSKFYFIIIDGGGYGERVFRIPITGNETVLDAMSMIGGLPEVSSRKNMWIARATTADADHPTILPIDWRGITQLGNARTNYQVYPNDRLYVKADLLVRINNGLEKVLAPAEKLLGVTLLGASTVNTIKNGSNTIGGTGTGGR
jgi:polysaccharide export outer membrane protein